MAFKISVEQRAGGTGKTTTATTLGVGLARKGAKVLLIDLDSQGDSASTMLGLKPRGRCISHLLEAEMRDKYELARFRDLVRKTMMPADRSDEENGPARPGLYVVPCSNRLLEVEPRLIRRVSEEAQDYMRKAGGNVEPHNMPSVAKWVYKRLSVFSDPKKFKAFFSREQPFDFVILDCPPSLHALTDFVRLYADIAIVPTELEPKPIRATFKHAAEIAKAREEGISNCYVAYVLPTKVDKRTNLAQAMWENLEKRGYARAMVDPIPRSIRVSEGPAAGGRTIIEYRPEHKTAVAYWKLIDRVWDEYAPEELKQRAKEVAYA
jgi:chromosome partitioning protein